MPKCCAPRRSVPGLAPATSAPWSRPAATNRGACGWLPRKELAGFPTRSAAGLAGDLLKDQSPTVELAMVASLASWPLDRAGPLLLQACGQLAYRTRKDAGAQLAQRWPAASGFSADAPPERRAATLADLRDRWREQFGNIDRQALAAASAAKPNAPAVSAERIARFGARALAAGDDSAENSPESRAASEELRKFGPDLEDGLEIVALTRNERLPEFVFRDILPSQSQIFTEMYRMTSGEVTDRRRAAGQLAVLAAASPLRPLARLRLAEQGTTETDTVIWLSLWQIIGDDPTEPSVRLAASALSHPAPDLRRRACEYLGRHGEARQAALLIPALGDESAGVARAAAAALGHVRAPEAIPALERSLLSTDVQMRFAAAASLARLGSPRGAQALERLAFEPDPQIRQQVANLMGELGDKAFLPTLIRLLDDRDGVRHAALENLPRVVGQDMAQRPGETRVNIDEARARWKEWYERQRTGEVAAAAASAAR